MNSYDSYFVCTDCGGRVLIDARHGEISCETCGLVKDRYFDDSIEYKNFDDYDCVQTNPNMNTQNIDKSLYHVVRHHLYNIFTSTDNFEKIQEQLGITKICNI